MANNTSMTVMDLLLATEAQAINGLLYNGKTSATLSRIWLPRSGVRSAVKQENREIVFNENNLSPVSCA